MMKRFPHLQSENLANALKAVIGEDKVRLEISESAGHGNPAGLPENMEKLLEFLDKNLK